MDDDRRRSERDRIASRGRVRKLIYIVGFFLAVTLGLLVVFKPNIEHHYKILVGIPEDNAITVEQLRRYAAQDGFVLHDYVLFNVMKHEGETASYGCCGHVYVVEDFFWGGGAEPGWHRRY